MRSNLIWMSAMAYAIGCALGAFALYRESYWIFLIAFFFIAKGGHWEERRNHV